MKIVKPLRVSLQYRPYRFEQRNYLSISAFLLLDFAEGWALLTEQQLWTLFNQVSIGDFKAEVLDLGIRKRHPELLLSAYAFSEYSQQNQSIVYIKSNNIYKELLVSGDRYWDGNKPSSPAPFTKIPLSWENSFGGERFPKNLLGKGHQQSSQRSFNELKQQVLPNIEDPGKRIHHRNEDYIPVNFSPIFLENMERNALMGTYDDDWRVNDAPGFARDIDWRYFNQAPEGQIYNSLTIGDQLIFGHMHPEKKEIITEVPPIVVKSLLQKHGTQELSAYEMALTTYWAYPHLEQAILTFQVDVPISGEDPIDDFQLMACVVEHATRPKMTDYYRDNIDEILYADKIEISYDKRIIDTEFISNKSLEITSSKDRLKKQLLLLLNEADTMESQLKEELGEHNHKDLEFALNTIDEQKKQLQKQLSKLQDTMTVEDLESLDDTDFDAATSFAEVRQKLREETTIDTDKYEKKELATKRRKIIFPETPAIETGPVSSFELLLQANDFLSEEEKLPFTDRQIEFMKEKFASAEKATPAFDTLKNNTFYVQMTYRAPRSYALNSLEDLATDTTLNNTYDLFSLEKENLQDKQIHTVQVGHLAVHQSTYSNIDFSYSAFVHSKFVNTKFIKCKFSSTELKFSRFINCSFEDCTFDKTGLDRCVFSNCQFLNCDFTQISQFRLGIYHSDFTECKLHEMVFLRLRFATIQFKQCEFIRFGFVECTGDQLAMMGCRAESVVFTDNSKFNELIISNGSDLKLFNIDSACSIQKINIFDSTLKEMSLRGVETQVMVYNSNLSSADLSRSKLSLSHFENTDLSNAILTKTEIIESVFKTVDLKYASCRGTSITRSVLEKVSFYFADLALIYTDMHNVLHDCWLEGANLYPKFKQEDEHA